MFPIINIFGREIGTYAVLAVIGLLLGGLYACYAAKRRGLDTNDMILMQLFAGIGALIGSHLLYGITNIGFLVQLIQNADQIPSFSHLLRSLGFIFGGGVFYGGLLGGLLAGMLTLKCKKLSIPDFADVIAPAIPLFHVFGRIGCFLGGCCYGVECSWGITYTRALTPEANGVPRFPVQLAESAFNFLLFCLLAWLLHTGRFRRRLLPLYLCVYAVGRFCLEFFRGDAIRGSAAGLSTSQWISLIVFAAGSVWLVWERMSNGATTSNND